MSRNGAEVVLVRHGETEWSRAGKHTGRTDVPLTEEGRRQAAALGRYLGTRRFALVLTSPLSRANETCRLAGLGDVAQERADLMEWDYGAYDGRTTAEIREERPGWTLWFDGVPGGETAADVGARATASSPSCAPPKATPRSSRTGTCCASSRRAGSASSPPTAGSSLSTRRRSASSATSAKRPSSGSGTETPSEQAGHAALDPFRVLAPWPSFRSGT